MRTKGNSLNEGNRVVLFALIDAEQHESLRLIAFRQKRSISDLTREAIDRYIRDSTPTIASLPSVLHQDALETSEVRASVGQESKA